MKKIGILTVVVSLVLSVAAFAGEKGGNAKGATGQKQSAPDKGKAKGGDIAMVEKELAAVKAAHEAVIAELQEIKKVAAEEKATKTTAKIDQLIARHNDEYKKRIEPLQKKIDAAKKGATDNQTPTTETPKKKSGKKNR